MNEPVIIDKVKFNKVMTRSRELAEAHYALPKRCQDVMYAACSVFDAGDTDLRVIAMPVASILECIGVYGPNGYREIYDACDTLLTTKVDIITYTNKGKKTITGVTWLSGYQHTDGSGIVYLEVSSWLKPYLVEVKEKALGKAVTGHALRLRGKLSSRIYEILAGYRGKKVQFEQEAFLNMLQAQDLYKTFAEFDRRILAPSIDEINTYSDLDVICDKIRVAKKCIALEFDVKNAVQMQIEAPRPFDSSAFVPDDPNLFKRLVTEYRISEQSAEELIKEFGHTPKRIYDALDAVDEDRLGKKPIRSIGAVTINAIRAGRKTQQVGLDLSPLPSPPQQVLSEIELQNRFQSYLDGVVGEEIARMTSEQMSALIQKIHDANTTGQTARFIKEGNLSSPIVRAAVYEAVRSSLPEERVSFSAWKARSIEQLLNL